MVEGLFKFSLGLVTGGILATLIIVGVLLFHAWWNGEL